MTRIQTLRGMMAASGDTLKLRCGACGHQDEWPRDKAFQALGSDASPFAVRRRLVCGECLARDSVTAWI